MGVAIKDTPKDSKPRGKSDRGNVKEIPFIFIAPCLQGLARPEGCQIAGTLMENLPVMVSIRATADSVRCGSAIPPISFPLSIRSDSCAGKSLKTLMMLMPSAVPRLCKNAHFQNTTVGRRPFSVFLQRDHVRNRSSRLWDFCSTATLRLPNAIRL
jgi:hypothetical protein